MDKNYTLWLVKSFMFWLITLKNIKNFNCNLMWATKVTNFWDLMAITNHGMWQISPTGRTSRFPSNKHGHFKLLYARYFNDYSRQKKPLTVAILNSCSKEVCKAKRKAPWNFFCLQNYRSRPTTLTKEKLHGGSFHVKFANFSRTAFLQNT